VLLLPVLIWLVLKLLPPEVLAECRAKAEEWSKDNQPRLVSLMGVLLIVFFGLGAVLLCGIGTFSLNRRILMFNF